MRRFRYLVVVLVLVMVLEACNRKSSMRIRTADPDKDRKENLEKAAKDSLPRPKKDSLTQEVIDLKNEQFNFLANLIINNMVRAQQAAYDGRYAEAEKLLLQTLKWYPTGDALMLLGSVYEVQGRTKSADSCWLEARRLDPTMDNRISDVPAPRSEPQK